jgi:integrase
MAAAKSLTPAELQTVLAYTATQPYAQRNRAMLMMTVAAGLRVSEVAGLTLGDILDSTGTVRSEVFLQPTASNINTPAPFTSTAAYNKSWQTTSPHAPTSHQNFPSSQHIGDHAVTFHPTHWHSTFTGFTNEQVLAMPAATQAERHF